jgi:hypothetical protein
MRFASRRALPEGSDCERGTAKGTEGISMTGHIQKFIAPVAMPDPTNSTLRSGLAAVLDRQQMTSGLDEEGWRG